MKATNNSCMIVIAMLTLAVAPRAQASAPNTIEVNCDVDRTPFRAAARNETQAILRLWDAESAGTQCGSDHVLQMTDLIVMNTKTDSFDGQKPRRFASIRAVLGSDTNPIELCAGAETWLDVSVGSQTFTCDFSAKAPQNRRRLVSVPFARIPGQGVPGAQGPQGPPGPTGATGPQGVSGFTTCTVRNNAENTTDVTVNCNSGEIATGGGCNPSGQGLSMWAFPIPAGGTPTGWECSGNGPVRVWVVCCH